MTLDNQRIDRTGTKFEHESSLLVTEVVQQVKGSNLYLAQDHARSDPAAKSGAYFITDEQIEVMIIAYEAGLWIDDV